MKKTTITYLKHSGFFVETEKSCLLFDYWKGSLPLIPAEKTLYVFASHAHHDHYAKAIFDLSKVCKKVYYILSFDIRNVGREWENVENVTFLDIHESKRVGDCEISSLKSTDEGLAFTVKVDGRNIYHAGDLHDWYWPGEPEEENLAYGKAYKEEIARIKDQKFDFSFVVLDPRQEYAGGWGMDYFLENVKSRYVFPMHLWGAYEYLKEYKDKVQDKYPETEIIEITNPGQSFVME